MGSALAGSWTGVAGRGWGALTGFSFFCFFFRPRTGACSSGSFGASAISLVSCFKASLRCFRCWLLVVVLTAADPILLGGGELAREWVTEAEITEAVSLTISLAGVSGL